MLKTIISGGQTGADIAGIDAAIENNFPYGGWLPKGRRTLEGPLDTKYIMKEMPTKGYPKRTEQNVLDSDGTAIFQQGKLSGGSDLTRKLAIKHGKPWLHLDMRKLTVSEAGEEITGWVKKNKIEILNVAGKSASSDPEIYDIVFRVMSSVLE